MNRGLLLFALAATVSAPVAGGQTTVHRYRYVLDTKAQEPKYIAEVPADAGGQYFAVETDSHRRIQRVASIRHGEKESETIYHFATGSTLPTGGESFNGDQETGTFQIQRNTSGERIREDYLTVTGALTGYVVYSYGSDSVEEASYTADGKKKGSSVNFYSPKEVLIRSVIYPNPEDQGHHTEIEYDDGTGLKKTARQFLKNVIDVTRSYIYDAAGDLIREDGYLGASGEPFAHMEFVDGLQTKRAYASGGDAGKEIRYTYDEKRWLKETSLFYKDVLVCRLVYDRLPDGTVRKTLALGPSGDLWAEYPDAQVRDVNRNGEDAGGKPVVLHKTGSWY